MKIAYARSALPTSIFLAGPTPRPLKDGRPTPQSWRPVACEMLEGMGFTGTVFVPEDGDGSAKFSYDDQIEWELQALHSATVKLFWIPRTEDMPAFTTNIEFGHFIRDPNCVVGWPADAEKMKYLNGMARLYGKYVHTTLRSTLLAAVEKTERAFPTSSV